MPLKSIGLRKKGTCLLVDEECYMNEYQLMLCLYDAMQQERATPDMGYINGVYTWKSGKIRYRVNPGTFFAMQGDVEGLEAWLNWYAGTGSSDVVDMIFNEDADKEMLKQRTCGRKFAETGLYAITEFTDGRAGRDFTYSLHDICTWSLFRNPRKEVRAKLADLLDCFFLQVPENEKNFYTMVMFENQWNILSNMDEWEERIRTDMPNLRTYFLEHRKWETTMGVSSAQFPYRVIVDYLTEEYEKGGRRKNVFAEPSFIQYVLVEVYGQGMPCKIRDILPEYDIVCDEKDDRLQAEQQKMLSLGQSDPWGKQITTQFQTRFLQWIHQVKEAATSEHYVPFLNEIWRNIENLHGFYRNRTYERAYAGKTERRQTAYMCSFIRLIKEELQSLLDEGVDVRAYYGKNMKWHDNLIREIRFFKDGLKPQGEITLRMKDLSHLGMPFWEKHQKMLLHVWNEIQVRIVQPSRLYVYQKRILETQSGKLIAEAVRYGILPREVLEELLAYALDDPKYKKLCPFLIWLAWGGMDYIEEKGADENGN